MQEKKKQTRGKILEALITTFTGPFSHTMEIHGSGKLRYRLGAVDNAIATSKNKTVPETRLTQQRPLPGQENAEPPQLLQVTMKGTPGT